MAPPAASSRPRPPPHPTPTPHTHSRSGWESGSGTRCSVQAPAGPGHWSSLPTPPSVPTASLRRHPRSFLTNNLVFQSQDASVEHVLGLVREPLSPAACKFRAPGRGQEQLRQTQGQAGPWDARLYREGGQIAPGCPGFLNAGSENPMSQEQGHLTCLISTQTEGGPGGSPLPPGTKSPLQGKGAPFSKKKLSASLNASCSL